jgi:hypothetical protein
MPSLHARRACSAIGAGTVALLIAVPIASAGTIDVTNTADTSGSGCSLRDAVSAANNDAATGGCAAGSGADTLTLHAGTYEIAKVGSGEENNAQGDFDIRSAITITGDGPGASIIDGKNRDRVIDVHSGTVVLKNLTVTGGKLPDGVGQGQSNSSTPGQTANGATGVAGQAGGGIRSAGNLTLDGVHVRDNVAGGGGTGGYATHTNAGNANGGTGGVGGNGGGIANSGALRVVDSRIAGNRAGEGGWGGAGNGGDATIVGADGGAGRGGDGALGGDGGGIYTSAAITVERTVIASNQAGKGGSGWIGTGGNGANGPSSTTYQDQRRPGRGGAATGGTGGPGGHGGGIITHAATGTLVVSDSALTGNSAGTGGPGQNAEGGNGGNGGGVISTPGPGNTLPVVEFVGPGDGGTTVGGKGGYGGSGGAFAEHNGTVQVERTSLTGNKAGSGASGGRATAGLRGTGVNSLPGVNHGPSTGGEGGDGGSGGGVHTSGIGAKTLTDSTVDGNTPGSGGTGGPATGVTANNWNVPLATGGKGGGAGAGGGLDSHITPLTITRATITSNTIGTRGGGGTGSAGGAAGGDGVGSAIVGGTTTRLSGSIVAENQAPRCYGAIEDGSNNVDFPADPVCPGALVDPLLGPLANNGGIGSTRALTPASPVIDTLACNTSKDQRGVPRPTGAKCDVGAYEYAAPAITDEGVAADVSSATLSANVNPYAASASVVFEYGTTPAYGATTDAQTLTGLAPKAVSANVAGLAPGTTYFFRVRATSDTGATSVGPDRAFRTAGDPPAGGGGTAQVPPPTPPQNTGQNPPAQTVIIVFVNAASTVVPTSDGGLAWSFTATPGSTGKVSFASSSAVAVKAAAAKKKKKKLNLGRANWKAGADGKVSLKLKLSKANLKILKKLKKLKVTATVTPKNGAVSKTTLVLKAPKKKKR